jgi:fatty-acyl-CoA synthase
MTKTYQARPGLDQNLPAMPLPTLAAVKERLALAPARIAATARVARRSGMVWGMSASGLRAAAAALLRAQQSPSLIYRIHAANTPEKAAIVWRDRTLSFSALDASLDRIGAALVRRGFERRQSAIVMVRNRPEFIQAQAAVGRVGGSAVSVSWRSTAAELEYLVPHSGARFVFFEHDLWPALEQALPRLPIGKERLVAVGGTVPGTLSFDDLASEPTEDTKPFARESIAERLAGGEDEDAAVVVYTSGTTGKPKGAVRRFPKDTFAAAMRFIAETPMRISDVHLVACPLYHSTAFGFGSLTHLIGGTVVLMDEFKAETFLELVEEKRVTTTAVVPTMLHRVLALGKEAIDRRDTRSLRAVFSGGAPLPGPLAVEFMDVFGDVLFNFYGATETGLVTLAKPADLRAAPGTIGRALPGNDVRLLGEDRRPVPVGSVGELFVKNDLLVSGYHEDPEATQSSMVDGYFSVGDLARCDREGRYFIEGRKRDMIISGGVNVYPAEVEAVFESHPDVAEVAVVGLPDREWGERVCAFLVPRDGRALDAEQLKAWARERLAGPKVPREYRVVASLPRNPTGKVLKRELRGS